MNGLKQHSQRVIDHLEEFQFHLETGDKQASMESLELARVEFEKAWILAKENQNGDSESH